MPRTPLFPPDGVRAEIVQGEVGSCYLLTSLDLAFNVVDGGRQLAKQRFVEYPDGSIGIKIPRNRHSAHLDPAVIGSKYILDKRDPNFDEWIIPKGEVDRIDSDTRIPKRGVSSSNCLAVKLLERLSTYYYVKPPRVAGIGESILAHNQLGHGDRYLETAPGFVATLMGMHTDKLFGENNMLARAANFDNNIRNLIHLKEINPNSPVYIEMDYGQPDAFGRIHGAHALRIDKIVANPSVPGGYEFHLVNPWDNSPSKVEKFNINELRSRHAWFSHFSMSPTHAALTNFFCQCDKEIGKRAYADSKLMNSLLMVVQHNPPHWPLNVSHIQFLGNLHKTNPQLFPVIEKLLANPLERINVCHDLHYCRGNPAVFIPAIVHRLLANPDPSLLASLPMKLTAPALYDIGVRAKSTNNLAVQAQLSSPAFLKMFFDQAVKELTDLGYDKNLVKEQLERDLMNCSLTGSLTHMNNVHFKNFLNANIFTISNACQVLPVSIQNSKTLDYYLTTPNAIRMDLVTKVASINPATIDSVFINDYFTRSRCANPNSLFEGLYKLNSTNPNLAKHLTEIAQQKMEEFQPGSYVGFKNNVLRNGPPHLANMLTTDKDLQAKTEAQAVITKVITQMNAMPVVYADVNNRVAVNKTASYLRTQAATILSSFEYQQAKRVLNLPSDPPEVLSAYMAKLGQINSEYNQHLVNCTKQEAKLVIAKQINALEQFIPNVTGTVKEMEKSASRLRDLLTDPQYIEAKNTLGLTADPAEITRPFIEKLQAIDHAVAVKLSSEKPHFMQHVQEDASASLHKASKKGPVELLKAVERLKDQYEDPYGDGLLNAKEKEKLFKLITPDKVSEMVNKIKQIQGMHDEDLLIALEQLKTPMRKGAHITPEMAKLHEFLGVDVHAKALSSKEKIEHCLKDIEVLHVNYRSVETKNEIVARKESLLTELHKLVDKPEYAAIKGNHEVLRALQSKEEQINRLAEGMIQRIVAGYEARIKNFPVQFSGNATNAHEVDREHRQLRHKLTDIMNHAIRDLGELTPALRGAQSQIEERLNAAAQVEKQAFHKVEAAIDFKRHVAHHKSDVGTFEKHLAEVEKMVKRVKVEHPEKYTHAKTLYDSLKNAKKDFLNPKHSDSQNMDRFCEKCKTAIDDAKPHLQKHTTNTGWKALDNIIDWFKSKLSKTASEKVADDMSVEINKTLSR